MNPVMFPVVEMAVADHLATALAARGMAVPVVNGVPHERPSRYVLVLRIGGTQSNLITDRPRIVAECCDQSGPDAAELAATVRALLGAIAPGSIGGIWVDRVLDMGLVYSPDPDTNDPRYVITCELHVRGAVLA
ncbi:hypothetical protein [Nocardia otitidiscaviarum]|uniref:hypothetical protein n=1 Tax=Nocardia otitidiscaviarum TaxID=1823 RepID=UPI0006948AE6|nr:hypothetical protein [Nocardia otitidiscaviarum]